MESLSKQELISTITKQADQIKRYEGRLRDVVAAYKGLAKEKEALEISLKALNKTESDENGSPDSITALTVSLSTLTAEKSRMEEAFQADKKVTREKSRPMLDYIPPDGKWNVVLGGEAHYPINLFTLLMNVSTLNLVGNTDAGCSNSLLYKVKKTKQTTSSGPVECLQQKDEYLPCVETSDDGRGPEDLDRVIPAHTQ